MASIVSAAMERSSTMTTAPPGASGRNRSARGAWNNFFASAARFLVGRVPPRGGPNRRSLRRWHARRRVISTICGRSHVHMYLAVNSYPLDRLRRPTPPGASRRFDVFPGQLFAQIRTVNRGSNFIYDPLKRPRRCVFSASRFSAGASRDRGAAGRQPGGSRPARTDARRVLSRHTRDAPGRCPGEGSRRITGIEVAGDARQSSDRRRGR